ncbi:MAG: winged helix-turn-helix domain-containing protein [Xanthomonadales bacterium]|nr:winged helix-turn-helix domain-containing protein [Xanthomonadales bacterium]
MWGFANKTYLAIHGCEIDLAASRIKGLKGWIQLKPKSMGVLEYLLNHPQSVCTREEILNAVWGRAIVTDDVLSQAIRELRKVFNDDFKSPAVIETIPRSGYRLLLEPVTQRRSFRAWYGLVMLTIAAIAIFAVYSYNGRSQELQMQTVVVLPFEQPQGELELVADGLVDEITAQLARLQTINVVARTSAFAFHGSGLDIPAFAKKLNADMLIEGSVYREGEQYRIHIQLVDHDGLHHWAETFTETSGGLFQMFNRVANTVASRFGTVETTQADANNLPDHLYVNYLQAENMLRTGPTRWTEELPSIYESILQEVPEFANAWAGLAEIEYKNGTSPVGNFKKPGDAKRWLARSRRSAEKALQIDPVNKRALAVTAQLAVTDNLWLEADGLYRRALEKHPGDAAVLTAYAQFLYKVGYVTQALEVAEQAFKLNLLSPTSSRLVAIGLFARGDLGPAMEYTRLSGQLRGSRDTAMMAQLLVAQGHVQQASQVLVEDGWSKLGWRERWFPHGINVLEGNESTEIVLQLMDDADQHGQLEPVTAVMVYAWLGAHEKALDALIEFGNIQPFESLWLPNFDEMRRDPGFIETMRSFGVVDLWQQRGPPDGCKKRDDEFFCD